MGRGILLKMGGLSRWIGLIQMINDVKEIKETKISYDQSDDDGRGSLIRVVQSVWLKCMKCVSDD